MKICYLTHNDQILSEGRAPTTNGARLAALRALSAAHDDLPSVECQYRVFLAYMSVSATNTQGQNHHAQ